MIALYIGVVAFCTSTLIATIVINRRAQQALARLRHPTVNSLVANIAYGDQAATLIVNGNIVAKFLPVRLPPGGGMELGFHGAQADDGTMYLYCIEATSMTGPPEDIDDWMGV